MLSLSLCHLPTAVVVDALLQRPGVRSLFFPAEVLLCELFRLDFRGRAVCCVWVLVLCAVRMNVLGVCVGVLLSASHHASSMG